MTRIRTCEKAGAMRVEFGASATGVAQSAPAEPNERQERPVYVSLRVTPQEKARLVRDAAGMSLSAYVRERLFGGATRPRKGRGRFPVKDHEALAKVLRALGRSNLSQDFDALSWAVQDGSVHLDRDSVQALRQACTDISAMRRELVAALGLKERP